MALNGMTYSPAASQTGAVGRLFSRIVAVLIWVILMVLASALFSVTGMVAFPAAALRDRGLSGVMDFNSVSSGVLGPVAGQIRLAECFDRGGLAEERDETEADANSTESTVACESVARYGPPDIVSDPGSFGGSAMLQEDAEFIATEPGHRVPRPYARSDDRAQLSQQLVSGQMAAGVVDSLETVQIHEADHMFGLPLGRSRECPLQSPLELGPVDQTREGVVGGAMS
jgi:hypothetical protein